MILTSGASSLMKKQGVMPFLFEANRQVPSSNFGNGFFAPGVIVVVAGLIPMPVPFDPPMMTSELVHGEIIPDEKKREHGQPPTFKGQQVVISPLPALLPFGTIFKVRIVAVINFHHRREDHDPEDVTAFDFGVVVLDRLWRVDVLDAAMGVRVNDGEPHDRPPLHG